MRHGTMRAWLAVAALAAVGAGTAGAAETAAGEGVWVEHDVSFTYMGFTTHYSCGGIESKVRYVMRQLGARPGFKVTAGGCVNMTGPEVMPSVRIRAALPAEATPEVLARLAGDQSRRELKARAQGKGSADEASARFPVRWRTVAFRESATSDVQDGDCELMEQLRRDVLPKLGVKELPDSHTRCAPHQVTLNAVDLKLQVLEPVPAPPAAN